MYKLINIIKNFNYKRLIVPSIFLLLYVFGFVFIYYKLDNKKENVSNNIQNDIIENEEEVIEDFIYVDIKGEVENPGVYKLTNGSRVNDLISMSGGLTKNANTRFINLSKVLNDGDAIVIYSNSEIKEAEKSNIIYVETPCVCEEVKNDACITENISNEENTDTSSTSNKETTSSETTTNKININTADVDELVTLNGIGEAKAKSIIEYRTKNGNFKSIEELTNVSGISETLFSKIKENITI